MGRSQRWALLLVSRLGGLVVLVFTLSACSTVVGGGPAPVLAVGRDGSTAEVLYLCRAMPVTEVSVRHVDEGRRGSEAVGDVVWRIEAEQGVAIDEIVLGETPPGFDESTPLTGVLPTEQFLFVTVKTDSSTLNVEVRLSDLTPDEVAVYFGEMSREDFENHDFDC